MISKKKKFFTFCALAGATLCCASGIIASQKSVFKSSSAESVNENATTTKTEDATIVNFSDASSWNFRTFHVWDITYATGYSHSDFHNFLTVFYGSEITSSWDKEETIKGWCKLNNVDGDLFINDGSTTTSHSYVFPWWVSGFKLQFVNNNNWLPDKGSDSDYHSTASHTITSGSHSKGTVTSGATYSFPAVTITKKAISVVSKEEISSITIPSEDTVVFNRYPNGSDAPAAPTLPSGYTFNGWYTDQNLTTPFTKAVYTTDSNIYASVSKNNDGYYLFGDFNSWTRSDDYKMTWKQETNEYYLSQAITKGQKFLIARYGGGDVTYFGWSNLDSSSSSARSVGQIIDGGTSGSFTNCMQANVSDTFTPYFKIDESTTSKKIWISEVSTNEYTVGVTRNSTETKYSLVVNSGTEYKTESNVSLEAGDILAVYKNDILQTMNAKVVSNNNCWNNSGVTTVTANITDKIYVDISAATIFCAGLDTGKVYMAVNNVPVSLTHNSSPLDPSFDEWYVYNYSFAADDVMKYINTQSGVSYATMFAVTTLSEGTYKYFNASSKGITCSQSIQCDMFVKLKSGADEAYFGSIAPTQALNFANKFNSEVGTICSSGTASTEMATKWSSLATEFAKLVSGAKEILKLVEGVKVEDPNPLKVFGGKYDFVYLKYKDTLSLTDFVERNPTPTIDPSIGDKSIHQNSYGGIIILSASLGTSLVAAATIFIIYKKKSKKKESEE